MKRILQRRGKMFQQCYETALKSNPLALQNRHEFTINSRVKADASAVKDSVGGGVAKCVVPAMKRIRFPKPDDGEVTISELFRFPTRLIESKSLNGFCRVPGALSCLLDVSLSINKGIVGQGGREPANLQLHESVRSTNSNFLTFRFPGFMGLPNRRKWHHAYS